MPIPWVRLLLLVSVSLVVQAELSIKDVERIVNNTKLLARQVMLQQYYFDELMRSSGDSGIQRTRLLFNGEKPHESSTWTSMAATVNSHNHAQFKAMSGMGEFTAVLNGVEFRTRHLDYMLWRRKRKPKKFNHNLKANKEIVDYPPVPEAVTKLRTVEEQSAEMREWIKAWVHQDYSKRDYRRYFRPVMCYLEGTWTNNPKTIDEPASSDHHALDAKTYIELSRKVRFLAYTGGRDDFENLAVLPTSFLDVNNDSRIIVSQWVFDINCHNIEGDLPLKHVKYVDDLKARLNARTRNNTVKDMLTTRMARFKIARDGERDFTLLDEIMQQIPGFDGYGTVMNDSAFGHTSYHFKADPNKHSTPPLNTGYYHRWYRHRERGPDGRHVSLRGFSDRNMFAAMTTHPVVTPKTFQDCSSGTCETKTQRWTYAIPLELIYLTPLHSWNPYDLEMKRTLQEVRKGPKGVRNGKNSKEKAFNGIFDKRAYMMTPESFYDNLVHDRTKADTAGKPFNVLDRKGVIRAVRPSGLMIHTPPIPGLGPVRIRYPVFPGYDEGSDTYQEIDALKDIALQPSKYRHMFYEDPLTCGK